MSTQEIPATVVEPEQPPISKKQRKRKAAAEKQQPVEPIEELDEPEVILRPLPDEEFYYEHYSEGYSFMTLVRGVLGGFGTGVFVTTLVFGWLRAKEIQRAAEEFIVLQQQEQQAEDQRRSASAPLPLAESPSANA